MHHLKKNSEEILRAFANFGVMSTRTLESHLNRTKYDRALNETLRSLVAAGLIVQRPVKHVGGPKYYHLSCGKDAVEKTPHFLQLKDDGAAPTQYNSAHLFHDDKVANVHINFDKLPYKKVLLNDRQFSKSKISNTIVALDQNTDMRLFPDLCLIVFDPRENSKKRLNIAIEIELNLKSEKRIREKLVNYALKTRFDSVLYFISQDWWTRIFNRNMNKKVIERSFRIGHYKEIFLGFQKMPQGQFDPMDLNINFAKQNLSFPQWINILWKKKYDEDFLEPPRNLPGGA